VTRTALPEPPVDERAMRDDSELRPIFTCCPAAGGSTSHWRWQPEQTRGTALPIGRAVRTIKASLRGRAVATTRGQLTLGQGLFLGALELLVGEEPVISQALQSGDVVVW
jgi:hypothetical protein